MAVKQNNGGAIIGGIMTVVGGIMLFSSFSALMDGLGAFVSALSTYSDVEYAFEYAMWVAGGRGVVGLLGIVLLFVGIMASRAAAGQVARNAAQKGSDAVAHARSEAEQRAREQQRAMEERAKQASRDAQARVQERQRAMSAGGSGGQQAPSPSQTRLDELRNRFANDPRLDQVREQARARGYGDIADRYLPRAQPQQQAPQGGQNAHSADGYGAGQNVQNPMRQPQPRQNVQHPNPMRQSQPQHPARQPAQHSQAAQSQPRPQVSMQRPSQAASQGRPSRSQQDRVRQQAKADAKAARIAADAFTDALKGEFSEIRGFGDARKRQSALISSALTTNSLSRTSLSTSSLLGSSRRRTSL